MNMNSSYTCANSSGKRKQFSGYYGSVLVGFISCLLVLAVLVMPALLSFDMSLRASCSTKDHRSSMRSSGSGASRIVCDVLPETRCSGEQKEQPPTTRDRLIIKASQGAGMDAFICSDSNNRDWNAGGDEDILVSPGVISYYKLFRAMIYFDLSLIDPSEMDFFSNATLNLYCYRDEDGDPANPLEVSIYSITQGWHEGVNSWGLSQNGFGATWETFDGTNQWETSGATHNQTAIHSTWVDDYGWFKWECNDVVKNSIINNASFNGFLFKGTSTGKVLKYFHSSEHSFAPEHPFLEVNFFVKPTIETVTIDPSVVMVGSPVNIRSMCNDPDNIIENFQWVSSRDGVISAQDSFEISNLSVGTHNVSLTITSLGNYSVTQEAGTIIVVEPPMALTGVQVDDAPEDQGGVIVVSWDEYPSHENFDHFSIYISTYPDFLLTNPEITVTNISTTRVELGTLGGLHLSDGQEYYVSVVPFDKYGFHSQNYSCHGPVVPLDNVAPPPVEGLLAFDTPSDQGHSITLQWSPIPLTESQQSTNYFYCYNVYLSTHSFSNVTGMSPSVEGIRYHTTNEFQLDITNGVILVPDTDYYVAVTTRDARGNEDKRVVCSGPVRAVDNIAPGRVEGLFAYDRAGDQGGVVGLQWDVPIETDIDHFNVYVATVDEGTVEGLVPVTQLDYFEGMPMECFVFDLSCQETSYFYVTSVDAEGNELKTDLLSVSALAKDDIAPNPVLDFTAEDTPNDNGGSITLDWRRGEETDILRYIVYGSANFPITDTKGMVPILWVDSTNSTTTLVTNLLDSPVKSEQEYYFAIVAQDVNHNLCLDLTLSGPVRAVDNVAPEIIDIIYNNGSALNHMYVFNATKYVEGGVETYEHQPGWFNLSLLLDTFGDDVDILWRVDGVMVGTEMSQFIDLLLLNSGNHTVRVEVLDTPFHLYQDIHLTLDIKVIETERERGVGVGESSFFTSWLFLVILVVALVVGGVVGLIVRRFSGKDAPLAPGKVAIAVSSPIPTKSLGKINVVKKVKFVGRDGKISRRGREVTSKNKLHYLEDRVGKQFTISKKRYKLDKTGVCVMINSPPSEFQCPASVVKKCGLECSQKIDRGRAKARLKKGDEDKFKFEELILLEAIKDETQ